MRQTVIRTAISCLLGVGIFTSQAAHADQSPSFHDLVIQTYSFDPRSTNNEEVAAKAHAMDGFWRFAMASKESSLPLLRAELASGAHPRFFSYDGAKLLITLSQDRADLQLAANSLASINISDVERDDYFRTVHELGVRGADVAPAAMKILDDPKFWVSGQSGSRPLPQAYALAFSLFTMPEKNFLRLLTDRLRTEVAVESQMSILFALWCTFTPESKAAIAQFLADESKPKEAREFAAKLPRPPGRSFATLFLPSVERLKEGRRSSLAHIDQATATGFNKYTAKILAQQ